MQVGESIGDWVIERWLGRGASGEVWAARSARAPERRVAIKRLPRPSPRALARLEREAEALRRVRHPSVVTLHGVELQEDAALLVMEEVAGRPLSQLIRRPPISADWALHICAQLAGGLAAAHAAGVSHRDLKPANVLVDAGGRAVILDFGTAALQGGAALTRPEGRRPATPAYAPPEWFDGGPEPEGACDVYALGQIALELTQGRRAFPQRDPAALEAKKRSGMSISSDLQQSDLLRSMLSSDPEARPSAEEVSEALAPWRARPAGAPDAGSETLSGSTWGAPPEARGAPEPLRGLAQVGRYALLEELGRGGMGVVYRAHDPNLDREVALKVLLSGAHAGAAERARLLREARAVAQLDHPNLVRVLDQGTHEGRPFLTMALIDGPTLSERLRAGPVSPREAAAWTRQLALALAHAHSAGLVHRDVKPGNVLLQGGAVPMLTDFGLVKDTSEDAGPLTRGGQLLGTPAYMAPEQARGELDAVGPWTDQYALGALLYRMLAGETPHGEHTLPELLRRVAEEPAPPLPKGVDPELAAIAHRALERERQRRYPSAAELAEDLGRFLRGDPVLAALPSPWRRLRSWAARRKLPLAAAALALVLAGILGLEGWQRWAAWSEEQARWAAADARWAGLEARLAGLEHAEAEALLDAFVQLPDNQETPALAEAWLRRAERFAGDAERERGALAQAYALASHEGQQVRALVGLARHFRKEHRWAGLGAALDTLEQRGERLPALRQALAVRDRAPDRVPEAEGPSLGLLREVTETPWEANAATPFLLEREPGLLLYTLVVQDGAGELRVVDPRDPRLPERRTLAPPEPLTERGRIRAFMGLDGLLLGAHIDSLPYALRLEGDALQATALTERKVLFSALSADTDGDGEREHYFGNNRHLMRLSDGPEGLGSEEPHPSTNAGNSEIQGLGAADLDGLPGEELVVATSNWGTYDLRVLGTDGEGGLALRARALVGRAEDALVLQTPAGPRLATWSIAARGAPIDARVFDADTPPRAPGLHLFELEGDALRWQGQLPGPSDPPMKGHGYATLLGDLDGDGLDEVIGGQVDDIIQIWWQRPDGSFKESVLQDLLPLALIQADADPALELVVSLATGERGPGGRVYVLGVGEDRLPPLPAAAATPEPPPRGLPGAPRRAWQRAEELVTMGLIDEAAERIEQLSQVLIDPEQAARAAHRAAALHASQERWERAAELYLRSAAVEALATEGLLAAQRCYAQDRRLEEELEVLRALRERGVSTPALHARAQQLASIQSAPTLRVDFSQPLGPTWRVGHPLGLRWDPLEGGLRVDIADADNFLELPLVYEGGYASLALTLDVERADWGAKLMTSLEPGAALRLTVNTHGGGGYQVLRADCMRWLLTPTDTELNLHQEGLRLKVDWTPWDQVHGCTITDGEGRSWRGARPDLPGPAPGEPLRLRLGEDLAGTGVLRVTLRSLELQGFALAPPVGPPQAELSVLHHRPEEALDQLPAGSPSLAAARYALGDAAGAERALIEAIRAQGPDAELLKLLFLVDSERHEGALRAALGQDYYAAFHRAWINLISTAPDKPEVQRALSRGLEGLETLPLVDHPDALAWLDLLIARAAARRALGDTGRCRQDLARAFALGEVLLAASPQDSAARSLLVLAALELALLELTQGQPEAAMQALHRGLELAPSPEWFADRLSRDPSLRSLRDQPGWEAVRAARRMSEGE